MSLLLLYGKSSASGVVITCRAGEAVTVGVSTSVSVSVLTVPADAICSGIQSSIDTSIVAIPANTTALGVDSSVSTSVVTSSGNVSASGVPATITTGSTSDVRLSWFEFDTKAVVSDVRFSWFAFDTKATTSDVRFSWFNFDTKAINQAKSGPNRLYWYLLQEEELKKYEQKQREEKKKRTGQGTETQPLERKSRPTKKHSREVEVETWVPPVLPKPIYHKPVALEIPPITQFLNIISAEFRSWLNPYSQKLAEWDAIEAANDDEHDIELLLLAA